MIHVEILRSELAKHKGVRIGETAVVSRKVHTIDPNKPEEVHIIMNSDAGRIFYKRFNENEIMHIDLFHELAVFDVKKAADYLKKSMIEKNLNDFIDYIDIQTGSGGGRLSGSLNYGMSESLKKDHLNHVHLAGLIPDEKLDMVFFLVDKMEEALQQQNIELRKVEKIFNEMGNCPVDMSPYATDSDTQLRQNWSKTSDDMIRQEVAALIEHFGSISEIEDVLDTLSRNKVSCDDVYGLKKKYGDIDDVIKRMEQNKFIERYSNSYYLTRYGIKLKEYIKINRKELELMLKKSIKNLPKVKNKRGLYLAYNSNRVEFARKGYIQTEIYNPNNWIVELDINETVKNAFIRCYFEKERFNIHEKDLVSLVHIPKMTQDICLIIDASASMAGNRLKNAKFLAKHLVLNAHRRVSVLAFQEKDVKVYVPFTRNFGILDKGLNDIISTGLTPLALALDKGISYMNSGSVKNPLMILITDGIPTVSLWTADPIKDAINAASKIARKNIGFCCIGLQPNKDCLINITKAAKGKLFIVDELNKDVLLDVTRKSGQLL
ncbi:MAG TPA: VWA domain-containing protein [Thermoanaerobacterales bacterium]|nr:VWA domain-containing protein [Thermoanaerobacterales bacterium]